MPAVGKEKDKEQRPRKKPGRVFPAGNVTSEAVVLYVLMVRTTPSHISGTEELHDRIHHFTSRIRELEGALQALQAQNSDAPHPLLLKDSVEELAPVSAPSRPIASSSGGQTPVPAQAPSRTTPTATVVTMEPDPTAITEFSGTLSVSGNGESSFFGSTARLEFLARREAKPDVKPSRLSHELFEFACEDHKGKTERLGNEIFQLRPPASEASRLCELYLKSGKVMYSPIPRAELFDEIFMPVYRAESFSDLQPETLALLFMVFAISIHFDPKRRTDSHDANEHYYLAKASLHLAARENTLHYVQTLIHMAQYLRFSGSESALSDSRSDYLCRAIRIGYKMGLHLHGIRWGLPEDLAQRRSRIFCEIFLLDTWTSFYSGRPPMVSLAFMDRATPKDDDEGVDAEGNKKPGFHTWTYKYAILLHSIMAVAFGPKPPSYPTVLDLDLKVRNFPVPVRWRPMCEEDTPAPPEVQMVRFLVSFAKESTLLNLHRSYFITALEELPEDLSNHQYIPSVLAVYRSAWRLMRGLRCIWNMTPELVSRMNVAWSQALSAALIMCLFVTRTPGSHLTDPALNELDLLVELFEEATPTCRTASDLLIDLRSLRRHSRITAGRHYQNEGYIISTLELGRLNGKTYLVPSETNFPTSTHSSDTAASHHSVMSPHQPSTSYTSFYGSTIKRDPSTTPTILSEISSNSTLANAVSLPASSLHPPSHSLPSSSTYTHPHHHLHAHTPYAHSHTPSTHAHTPTSTSHMPGPSASHAPRYPVPVSSPPSSHFTQQPPAPASISKSQLSSTSLHPTILQDIHDFTVRGTPAASSVAHYFDFPPQEEVDDASMALRIAMQPRGTEEFSASATRAFPGAADAHSFRTRGHSVPEYQSHQYQTPTPTQPHAQSHPPSALGHTRQESDYGFFQTLESSFPIEYAPQPRSPFTAANFGIPGMSGGANTSTMHASYQELVEHLGFH
ncbi:hypothetical protein D9756_006274 [Leucocoprinus leucothites]|uniref:Xylanolytic transcriptional activator regulatory domain-containing protein n=1 Tax=Leucocoprinus leucothites TaxID=201217 RepID=A0A8H5D3M7_9AGAR|nr:hypothetical protein D9756_006274 [Leucoagaricus leucothites]